MGETLVIIPGHKHVDFRRGERIFDLLLRHDIILTAPCGGQGTCGKCNVKITMADHTKKWVRACQYIIKEDLIAIEIPPQAEGNTIKEKFFFQDYSFSLNPEIRKQQFSIKAPDLKDQRSYWQRVQELLPIPVEADIKLLQKLPEIFTGSLDFEAVYSRKQVLTFKKAGTVARVWGAAVDIGTTTVAVALADLETGQVLDASSRTNPQKAFGADVISRIKYGGENKLNLARLQKLIAGVINDILKELANNQKGQPEDIYELTVAGNPAMLHLFTGINPSTLAQAPYIPVNTGGLTVKAAKIGININSCGQVYLLPCVSAFVGGDTIGAVIATEMDSKKEMRLLIDIGTNGEMVLGNQERLLSTSTAAGPAFEGAQIRDGMQAMPGAINRVTLKGKELSYSVIGGEKPLGLCGSALVGAVAVMLQLGVVNHRGRLLPGELLPDHLRERAVSPADGGCSREYVIAFPEETKTKQPVSVTQQDIRELQLAKGAIRAGVELLVKHMGISIEQVEEILLAGAFGNYLDPKSAAAIGLWPPFPPERIKAVGNASGMGALRVLLSREERDKAEKLAQRIEHLELSADRTFQDRFITAMLFPESPEL